MAGVVKTGDVGTLIKLDTGVDLTTANLVEIVARSPSGAIVKLAASAVDITKARHIKQADTLNEAGIWTLQAHATWTDGDDLSGDEVTLRIHETLEA